MALLVAFVLCFVVTEDYLYPFLVSPLYDIYVDLGVENPRMIYTALHEAFFTYMKLAFYAALFLSFPIMANQLWKFIAPGLYRHEKHAFMPFLSSPTPMLFTTGAALVYYFILPLAWSFFIGFQTTGVEGTLAIELEAKVNEYLALVIKLMFAFGIAFQLPVALTLMARAGLVTSRGLAERRKILHRHRLRRRRPADPARPYQPDRARHSHRRALRDLDLAGAHGRTPPRRARRRGGGRTRPPAGSRRPERRRRRPGGRGPGGRRGGGA